MPHYKLTYFNIRGRVEPTRLILAQAGVPYEDKRIAGEDWPKLKSTFPSGQLPLLEVDDTLITESKAIARYLARQYDLCGKNDIEAALCDSIVDGVDDITNGLLQRDPVKKKQFEQTQLKPFWEKFEKLLTDNGTDHLVGKQLTWADIVVFHLVQSSGLPCMHYPKLHHFLKKIGDVPKIKAWIEKRPKE